MAVPKSVVKYKKGEVVFTDSILRTRYTLVELTRAALRDVGKFLVRTANSEAMKLPGLKKSLRVRGRTSTFLYNVPWAKTGLPHLVVGVKHGTWYGEQQELGTSNQPRRQILRNAAQDNIDMIVKIESQYLRALEDERKALSLIDEGEYSGGGEDD